MIYLLQKPGDKTKTGSVKASSVRERCFAQKHRLFLQRNIRKVLAKRQTAQPSVRSRVKSAVTSRPKTGWFQK